MELFEPLPVPMPVPMPRRSVSGGCLYARLVPWGPASLWPWPGKPSVSVLGPHIYTLSWSRCRSRYRSPRPGALSVVGGLGRAAWCMLLARLVPWGACVPCRGL
jgi:hypothetical protein